MPIFPASGGTVTAAGLPPSLNGIQRFVAPNGNDSNVGDCWERPLKHLITAYNQLVDEGGGTIYYADGTRIRPVGSPKSGLHISGSSAALPANAVSAMPVQIIGVSSQVAAAFSNMPPAVLIGGAGADDMDDPTIWVSASVNYPISFHNVASVSGRIKSFRIGWDYTRDDDGEIIKNNITAASRADGVTTFTVEPYAFDIEKIERISNVVRVYYKRQPDGAVIFREDMRAFVDYDGAEFDPVVVTVALDIGDASAKFDSTGADFSAGTIGGPAIGTIYSTLVSERDYISVYGGVSEFPASQYKVIATDMVDDTEGSITVTDYYGYAPRSATASDTDIGTYAAQDRMYHGAARVGIYNPFASCISTGLESDDFLTGPAVDIANLIFWDFRDFNVFGYNIQKAGGDYGCRDPERRAAFLADCGAAAAGLGFGELNKCWGSYGGIRYHGAANASTVAAFKNIIVDQPVSVTFQSVPAVEILEMTASTYVYVENVAQVDGGQVTPTVRVAADCPPGAVTVNGAYGAVVGPCLVLGAGVSNLANAGQLLPNQQEQMGYYGELGSRVLSGRHLSASRLGAGRTFPFGENVAWQDPDDWVTQNATVTPGVRDPFGGNKAVRVTATGSGAFVYLRLWQGFVANTGDFWLTSVWMRNATGLERAYDVKVSNIDQDEVYLSTSGYYPRSGGTLGNWEPINAGGFAAGVPTDTVDSAFLFSVNLAAGEEIDIYLPTAGVSFVSERDDISEAECSELLTHLVPVTEPETFEVGVGSGQLTLTGTGTVYVPTYASDGVTIIGYVAQLQATVNP